MGSRLGLRRIGLGLVLIALASILFGGSPERAFAQSTGFEIGPCAMTLAVQLPIEFEYKGTVPTGFDGNNNANCTFTKEVETVTVTLTGPATHTETFTLREPTTEVSFPLPEDTLSITTLEIVPPGEYQREMTATSVDGETLVLSDQSAVLKTVTIIVGQTLPSLPGPATPPSVGGSAPSGWLLLVVASIGALLIGFGVPKLYRSMQTRRA